VNSAQKEVSYMIEVNKPKITTRSVKMKNTNLYILVVVQSILIIFMGMSAMHTNTKYNMVLNEAHSNTITYKVAADSLKNQVQVLANTVAKLTVERDALNATITAEAEKRNRSWYVKLGLIKEAVASETNNTVSSTSEVIGQMRQAVVSAVDEAIRDAVDPRTTVTSATVEVIEVFKPENLKATFVRARDAVFGYLDQVRDFVSEVISASSANYEGTVTSKTVEIYEEGKARTEVLLEGVKENDKVIRAKEAAMERAANFFKQEDKISKETYIDAYRDQDLLAFADELLDEEDLNKLKNVLEESTKISKSIQQ